METRRDFIKKASALCTTFFVKPGFVWSMQEENLPKVLILGDSISIGYYPIVKELMKGKAEVTRPFKANGSPENCQGTTNGIEHIDRWIGQFKQPDGSSSADKAEIKNSTSNGLPVTLVYVTGTHLSGSMGGPMGGNTQELPGFAMLAAIVETSSDPWFFKAIGPQATIDHWRPAFESFAKTFKQ